MSDESSQKRSLEISAGSALGWVFLVPSLVLAGGIVTYQLTGRATGEDPWAMVGAFLVAAGVAVIFLVLLWWLARRAARTPGTNVAYVIAQVSIFGGLAKILFLVLGGLALWFAMGLPTIPFFIWLATFGFLMLMGESIWLTRMMKSDTKSGDK